MKTLVISFLVFALLCGTVLVAASTYLMGLDPRTTLNSLYIEGKLFLYSNSVLDALSEDETAMLYRSTCTRKCHSRDVIEKRPRTAPEWEWIVSRMSVPDRAATTDRQAATITRYLQKHFLSNVPTFLPEKTMRFVRRHLWKSDFGADDLYMDVIYVPRVHLALLPYLIVSNTAVDADGAVFIIYLNTHQGVLPPWNLVETATMADDSGNRTKALRWDVLYEDGQKHHRQGILAFPAIDEHKAGTMEVTVDLPGIRTKIFQWELPVPAFTENDAL